MPTETDLPEGFRPRDPTAGDRAISDQTDVSFTVKEGPRGEPKIMIKECKEPGLGILRPGDSFLMLHCRAGIELGEAKKLAADMRRIIDVLTHTKFIT